MILNYHINININIYKLILYNHDYSSEMFYMW